MTGRVMNIANGTRGLRVLIVDDNRDAANTLALLIGLWGYETQTAYDGKTGLEKARGFCPDCIVLDIAMPDFDGCTVARRVRQHPALGRIKLIAMTAFSSDEQCRRIRAAGFDHHLVKPADPCAVEGILKMLAQTLRSNERNGAPPRDKASPVAEAKETLAGVADGLREVNGEIRAG
jgi:two-component system, OmpR family, response regulator